MITNTALVAYCRGQIGRPYWYACFGQVSTEKLYQDRLKSYPQQIGKWPESSYMNQLGQKVHDCSGLIKGAVYCNAEINGLPRYDSSIDWSANQMIEKCTESGDFSKIPEVPGLLVWKSGHVGVFVGTVNGKKICIESKGHNFGVIEGSSTAWKRWGRLPFIEYVTPDPEPTFKEWCRPTVPVLREGHKGIQVKVLQSALNLQGYDLNVDGHFGPKTKAVVAEWQSKKALKRITPGVVGIVTWNSIINS